MWTCLRLVLVAGALVLCMGPAGAEEPVVDEAVAHVERALEHHDAGRHAEAVASWERVLALHPDDPRAEFGLAKSLQGLATADSLQRAEKLLARQGTQAGAATPPTNVQLAADATRASVIVELADLRRGEERLRLLRQAIPVWEGVLAASPLHPSALAGLVRTNFALERNAAGVEYAERYIALCRESRSRWKSQRAQWAEQSGGTATPEQLQFFETKMENARKEEVKMLLLLGAMHQLGNEPEQAIVRFDAVLEVDPTRSAAYLGRATAHVALSRHAAAVEDLERYLLMTQEAPLPEAHATAMEMLARCRQALAEEEPPR